MNYAKEELVAEFSAAFLCAEAGISDSRELDNSAAYLASWLSKLRNDKTLAVSAAQRAQKAADFILQRSRVSAVAAFEEVAAMNRLCPHRRLVRPQDLPRVGSSVVLHRVWKFAPRVHAPRFR